MSEKELREMKTEIGTKKWYEKSLRKMVNSCWCYGTDCYNSHYISDFFKEKKLSEKRVWEIVENQLKYLNDNCYIKYNVYTDNENVSYNCIMEKVVE